MSDARETAASRLRAVVDHIAAAERRAGRRPGSARLVAVGKTFPAEAIAEMFHAGQRIFGENRVQEAEEKVPALPSAVEWHLIGHLQSNKAARAATLFDCIHGIDSPRLARRVARAGEACGRTPRLLLQVDLAGEAGKSGLPEDRLWAVLEDLTTEGLPIQGLMILPPYSDDPEETRPFFRRLAELGREGSARGLLPDEAELSMGMSGDYEVAVEEGATLVRVGTALFGARVRN